MFYCNNSSIMTLCQHDKEMTRSAHHCPVKQKVSSRDSGWSLCVCVREKELLPFWEECVCVGMWSWRGKPFVFIERVLKKLCFTTQHTETWRCFTISSGLTLWSWKVEEKARVRMLRWAPSALMSLSLAAARHTHKHPAPRRLPESSSCWLKPPSKTPWHDA